MSLIGKGCRANTKEKLFLRLQVPLSLWKRYGIYSRVILTDNDVEYICGQSWNDEMRTLRVHFISFLFYNYALIKLDNITGDIIMIISKNYNGSITITDIIDNEYIKQTYYFYTIKDAKRMFKEYLTTL